MAPSPVQHGGGAPAGLQRGGGVGQRRLDAFHDPAELKAWLQPLADADGNLPGVFEALSARADGQTYSRQWTLLRKDGQSRQVRLSISRMESADGTRIGYVGMAIDITEILQARAEARLSAEKFAGAFTSAALGMALCRWKDAGWMSTTRCAGYWATREKSCCRSISSA